MPPRHVRLACRVIPARVLVLALALGGMACDDSGSGRKPGEGPDGSVGADSGAPRDGGNEGELPYYRSGERLRALVLKADGLEPVFRGWHDTELDLPCTFRLASDGEMRCLPDGSITDLDQAFFAGADCKTPIADVDGTCAVDPYQLLAYPSCPETFSVHRVEELSKAASVYRIDEEGSCSDLGWTAERVLGAELSPRMFVKATETTVDGTGISRRLLEGEDGSVETVGAVLADSGEPCGPFSYEGRDYCVQTAYAAVLPPWFSDAECKRPVARVPFGACGMPQVAEFTDECFTKLYRIKGEATAAYESVGGESCVAREAGDPEDSRVMYELGAELGPKDLVPMEKVSTGKKRLRWPRFATPEGQAVAEVWNPYGWALLDNDLGVECVPLDTPSSGLRCVPASQADLVFADAECKEALLAIHSPCDAPAPKVTTVRTFDDCEWATKLDRLRVLRVGESRAPKRVYELDAEGTCYEISGGLTPDRKYFKLAEDIPAAELASLERTRE